jgi:Ca2+-binding RTX toxin-like protein
MVETGLVYGSDAGKSLSGSSANDAIIGNSGNDTITGFLGNDYINGRTGDDTVVYHATRHGFTASAMWRGPAPSRGAGQSTN